MSKEKEEPTTRKWPVAVWRAFVAVSLLLILVFEMSFDEYMKELEFQILRIKLMQDAIAGDLTSVFHDVDEIKERVEANGRQASTARIANTEINEQFKQDIVSAIEDSERQIRDLRGPSRLTLSDIEHEIDGLWSLLNSISN